mmetsp:Transcript_46105/g.128236  ORF Transcript_46105/g.128236 Transcript_46105/m.128236 type:complete len:311 (-) Transcript_46105:89-1021(-)
MFVPTPRCRRWEGGTAANVQRRARETSSARAIGSSATSTVRCLAPRRCRTATSVAPRSMQALPTTRSGPQPASSTPRHMPPMCQRRGSLPCSRLCPSRRFTHRLKVSLQGRRPWAETEPFSELLQARPSSGSLRRRVWRRRRQVAMVLLDPGGSGCSLGRPSLAALAAWPTAPGRSGRRQRPGGMKAGRPAARRRQSWERKGSQHLDRRWLCRSSHGTQKRLWLSAPGPLGRRHHSWRRQRCRRRCCHRWCCRQCRQWHPLQLCHSQACRQHPGLARGCQWSGMARTRQCHRRPHDTRHEHRHRLATRPK